MKTSTGQFLSYVLTRSSQKFYLTVTDRFKKSKKLMDNYCLPESFIEEIISLGRDRIDEVKVAVDDRIKTGANVIDSEGKLDVSIFS